MIALSTAHPTRRERDDVVDDHADEACFARQDGKRVAVVAVGRIALARTTQRIPHMRASKVLLTVDSAVLAHLFSVHFGVGLVPAPGRCLLALEAVAACSAAFAFQLRVSSA